MLKRGVSKMTILAHPFTPLFYCRILFCSKNEDVCKKLDSNPLRFDQDIRGFKLEKKNFIFPSANKKHRKSACFQDCFDFFSTWSMTPLLYIWSNMLKFNIFIKNLGKIKIYIHLSFLKLFVL